MSNDAQTFSRAMPASCHEGGPAARRVLRSMTPIATSQAMCQAAGLRGKLRHDEPMARHVSWRAGGRAKRTYQPADLSDLQTFLRSMPASEPICFVGLGSNLLVRDGGFGGTVVFTHWALRHLDCDAEQCEVTAGAGLPAPKIARYTALHGLAGAEFLAGVPGTVGGALAMNAGCYGGETWNVVASVQTVDRRGELHIRYPDEYECGYRHVALKATGHGTPVSRPAETDEWFVAGTFRLAPGDGEVSRRKIKDFLTRRIATQPLNEPNAGSVFRNPPGDFAARLIEACGLKGCTIGGAVVSPRHANFIVNRGAARAADIEALIERIRSAVKARFGMDLEREVRIIGDHGA